ncbi:MAG: cytochrome c oxidase accessory protein CcoG [Bacteroidota bacterium]
MSSLLAASDTGKRQWMYPLVRKGKYYKWRASISYVYLAFFFAGPLIKINGQPLLLLNFIERHFVIAGQVFWPQDIFLFMLASLVALVCIVLFTIAFGRIFCGWICPQTIFMEMFFRRIEIWIEGEPNQRKKLDTGPWTKEKIRKKGLKHTIFIILSFLIANTFLAYLISIESLLKIITEPVNLHWVGFASIWIFTMVFYLVYSRVRELVCTLICPYGRLQNVLTDNDTLMVAYNDVRGEPRGKLQRIPDPLNVKGDCVDCGLCVTVCPTGIDIRNGTQIECVNCTICIDACDQVMDKIHKPRNLIGYYSENMIRLIEKPSFTNRMKAYTAVIAILMGVLCYFIFSRSDMDMTVLRSAGMLYQEQPGGYVSNIYNAEIINKTNQKQNIIIKADDPSIKIKYIQAPGIVAKGGMVKTVFFVMIPANQIHAAKTDLKLQLMVNDEIKQTVKTAFVGPIND